jgi:hypothetical protein
MPSKMKISALILLAAALADASDMLKRSPKKGSKKGKDDKKDVPFAEWKEKDCDKDDDYTWVGDKKDGHCVSMPTTSDDCGAMSGHVWLTNSARGKDVCIKVPTKENDCKKLAKTEEFVWVDESCQTVPSDADVCLALNGNFVWVLNPYGKEVCLEVPVEEVACLAEQSPFVWVWHSVEDAVGECVVTPTDEAECDKAVDYGWNKGACFPDTEKSCMMSPYCVWYNDKAHPIPTSYAECIKVPDNYAWVTIDGEAKCYYKDQCQKSHGMLLLFLIF